MSQVEPLGARVDADREPRPWETGEVLSLAWSLFKKHWARLIALVLLGLLIMSSSLSLSIWADFASFHGGGVDVVAWFFAGLLVLSALLVAAARVALMVARGQAPDFLVFFSAMGFFLRMYATTAIVNIATLGVMLGFVLLVHNGVVAKFATGAAFDVSYAVVMTLSLVVIQSTLVGLGTALFASFVADGDGVVDSFKGSLSITMKYKGALFVFFLVLGLLNAAGALACGLGLLVTVPVSLIATALVYMRTTGRFTPRR